MHPNKLKNILLLSAEERYEYFIREVVQFKEIWTVATSEGYILFKDKENDEIFPIWPHMELAEKCCFDEYKKLDAIPEKIELDSFLNNCIPDMVKDNVLFGVLYNDKREGLAVHGNILLKDIKDEYCEIWG